MKVNSRNIKSFLRRGILKSLLVITIISFNGCDFDVPDEFVMPIWDIELKIPLVQTRYEMTDISNPDAGIFPTDDSLGFKIIQEGTMPATQLPALPAVPVELDQNISSGEIPGLSFNIDLPAIGVNQKIDVVLYGATIYQDTAKWCEVIQIPISDPPFTMDSLVCFVDSTTGDTLGRLFSFPTDSIRHMKASNYNSLIVAIFDSVMGIISSTIDTTIDLGISSIPLPSDPAIIASVDTLIIAESEENSIYKTRFKNNNIPTDLRNIASYIVTDNDYPINDSLANHNIDSTISAGQTYQKITNLSGRGLTSFLKMYTDMSLTEAPFESIVQIQPGSLYVDFEMIFQMAGLSDISVITNNVSLSDGLELEPIVLPEMDMAETGISRMEIYRNVLADNVANNPSVRVNRLQIIDLKSTFPFPMNFFIDFKNFVPSSSDGEKVRIDTTLRNGDGAINKIFNMEGHRLQSISGDNDGPDGLPCPSYEDWLTGNCDDDGWPDSSFTKFDLQLDISIPKDTLRIPLDGTPLGGFSMGMKLDKLEFESIGAAMYMELPSDPQEQEFPPGLTGAIPTEASMEIIFKNQIKLPIQMLMEFRGYNSLDELTYVPIDIDTIGMPRTSLNTDTSVTNIKLDKNGTTISIWESVNNYNSGDIPNLQRVNGLCDTCSSIIDLLGSNPVKMLINPQVKVDGRGELSGNKAIAATFRVTIPFALQLEPMTFMGGTATKIEAFEHDTRSKIRKGLKETNLVSNITNALPFGAEVAILMSNDSMFPADRTVEQLSLFRDTLATLGSLLPSDSLYIIRRCKNLSPDSSNGIYIFDVMTDFSECIDGTPYVIKTNGSGVDTIISYVDTLFKFFLPNPTEYYLSGGDTTIYHYFNYDSLNNVYLDSVEYADGMVVIPGTGTYFSVIDTSKIKLLTGYGDNYTMPRFYLPGTGNTGVFLSVHDYLDIGSFITFTLSSDGALGSPSNELFITYPNGGQTFTNSDSLEILWSSFGNTSETLDLWYSNSDVSDPTFDSTKYLPRNCTVTEGWVEIASDIENTGSYKWSLTGVPISDYLRIKIIESKSSPACDINGHYVKIINPARYTGRIKIASDKIRLNSRDR